MPLHAGCIAFYYFVYSLQGLARAGNGTRAGGLGAGGGGLSNQVVRVGQRGLRHAAKALAGSRGLVLLVGGEVERDEQNQVRAEDNDTSKGSKLLTSALAGIGHPGEVGRGEVGVRCEVDKSYAPLVVVQTGCGSKQPTEINDELDDLETSNPLLPPDADATGALEVVPVHDHVHTQVQGNGDPRDGGRADQLGVAKNSGGAMMVAVKEGYCELVLAARQGTPNNNGGV